MMRRAARWSSKAGALWAATSPGEQEQHQQGMIQPKVSPCVAFVPTFRLRSKPPN